MMKQLVVKSGEGKDLDLRVCPDLLGVILTTVGGALPAACENRGAPPLSSCHNR